MFEQTAAGIHTLYDSDDFIVIHMQGHAPSTPADASAQADAEPLHGQKKLVLARQGFEIVDKRSGRHVYLDGSWAEVFQQQISAWHHTAPTQEEVEDMLDNYTGLAGNPVMLH